MAALLIVAAIVTDVQYQRQNQPTVSGVGPDDPPAGVQLLYARDLSRPHSLIAYDWTGSRRGSISVPTWVNLSQLRMAPDGSRFMIDPQSAGDYAGYFDRLGRVLMESDEPAFTSQIWAADNAHVCVLMTTDTGIVLVTRWPGSPDRVARISTPIDQSNGPPKLDACSLGSDTAILQIQTRTSSGDAETQVLRLGLSTGKLLVATTLQNGYAVASHDGAYVATGPASGTQPARILRAGDLATPVADLGADMVPLGFSGDGSLLLASPRSSDRVTLEAVDWRHAKVVWRRDLGTTYVAWLARAAGKDFAIALTGGDVVVAHGDGKTTVLAGLVPLGW